MYIQERNKVAFHTLGCKLNFSETATLARRFEEKGYERVAFNNFADIYVINTCSVTENADKQFKTVVKSCMKINDEAFIIAVGCYAQLKPNEIAEIEGVDLVLGATEKFKITDYLHNLSKKDTSRVHSCEIQEANFYTSAYSLSDRTRAFLKVQDGCDYKCTYCTIPLARGVSRSGTLENVLKDAKEILARGVKEIVLTGVNIGDYGKGEFGNKKHEHTFLDLLKSLNDVKGMSRLRISSIEPNLLKDEIIEFCSQSKYLVPHFHIPLQSGSNTTLRAMRRRYTKELYINRVNRIKKAMPEACIGVDVIVGFPGESEEHFLETYRLLSELDIAYLHVFSYSERPNTKAVTMKNPVPLSIRKKRSKMLRTLSVKKRRAFYETQISERRKVLWENEKKEGFIYGFTENYVKVRAPYNPALINSITPVRLTDIADNGTVSVEFV